MQLRNTNATYGVITKIFHWIIGLIIIGLLCVGVYMTGMGPTPDKWAMYGLHKATGILVLFAVCARILWRMINVTPALPQDMKSIERIGAHAGHFALYIFMVGMPLSGWAMSSAGGHDVKVFEWFMMPPLLAENKELGSIFNGLHQYMGYALIATLGIHISAALYHHLWRKDNVLRRMLPW